MRQSCVRKSQQSLNILFLFKGSLITSSTGIMHDAQLQLFIPPTITVNTSVMIKTADVKTKCEKRNPFHTDQAL